MRIHDRDCWNLDHSMFPHEATDGCITLDSAIAHAKAEITADIAAGGIPATVGSFSELHDYVDANEYGGICEGNFFAPENDEDSTEADLRTDFVNALQTEVDAWLEAGRPPALGFEIPEGLLGFTLCNAPHPTMKRTKVEGREVYTDAGIHFQRRITEADPWVTFDYHPNGE